MYFLAFFCRNRRQVGISNRAIFIYIFSLFNICKRACKVREKKSDKCILTWKFFYCLFPFALAVHPSDNAPPAKLIIFQFVCGVILHIKKRRLKKQAS